MRARGISSRSAAPTQTLTSEWVVLAAACGNAPARWLSAAVRWQWLGPGVGLLPASNTWCFMDVAKQHQPTSMCSAAMAERRQPLQQAVSSAATIRVHSELRPLSSTCTTEAGVRGVLLSVCRCRKRYAIFKTHYAATLRLKNYFPFTLIDAMGSIEETRQQITKELRWGHQQPGWWGGAGPGSAGQGAGCKLVA